MERMRIANLGSVGLNTDVQPYLLPPEAWTQLYNCRTEDGELRSVVGNQKLFDLAIRPTYHTSYVGPTGTPYLVVSDGAKTFIYDIQGNGTEITPASGAWAGGFVSFPVLNGVLVVNSASDGPFYLDTSVALGPMLALPGWDPTWRCREMVVHRYYLVALNMTEGAALFPHKVRWSNSAQEGSLPTEWVASASNDAGSDLAGETPGDIVGGRLVRDSLYIVKEDAVYDMRWIGGQFIFEIDRMKGGVGTKLQRGFTEMLGSLVVVTTSDLRVFDGTRDISIADAKVRKGISNAISDEYWKESQVFYHKPTSTLYLAGVSAGYNQLSNALTYNTEEATWGHRDVRFSYGFDSIFVDTSGNSLTWDDLGTPAPTNGSWIPGQPWDSQTNGSWDKGLYQAGVQDIVIYEGDDSDLAWWVSVIARTNTNSDGSEKVCRAERVAVPIEGAEGLAEITRVWPEIRGEAPVDMWIGGQMAANGNVQWDGPFRVVPGETESIDPLITARYVSVKLQSEDVGSWSLGSITVEWEPAGEN